MIFFKTVTYKNFLSSGAQPVVIQLDKAPTTLIQGKNGTGKSTILDSIMFSLYKKPFRNINLPLLVNSVNNGDCIVEIEFATKGKQYKVVRGLKPNKFEIYEDGKMLDQAAATKDQQTYLEDTILGGLNEKVFRQVVVIGSADYRPFMQLKTADRREVIEELLDITIFSAMSEISKNKLSIIKKSISSLDYSIDILTEKVALHKSNNARLKDEVELKKTNLLTTIDKEEAIIKALQDDIIVNNTKRAELQQKIDLLSGKQKDMASRTKLLTEINFKTKDLTDSIKSMDALSDCPMCKQNVPHEHKQSINTRTVEKLEELKAAKAKVQTEVDNLTKAIDVLAKLTKAMNDLNMQLNNYNYDVSNHNSIITSAQRELKTLDTQKHLVAAEDELDNLEKELLSQKTSRLTLSEERQYQETVAAMLKDTGIKSRIIRQYIPVMNKIINDYLNRFGLPIEFTLDEQFNEVIKSRYRDGFGYNSFSEGEKQRINLSLMLAWRQLARTKNTTNTNLLILDETFDSSLDASATEELLNILVEMSEQQNIFIISHKQDLSDKLAGYIEFEKHGNFSRIKTQY